MIDIYYMEHDENISQMVEEFLGQRGYKVSAFSTIAEAKSAFEDACPTLALVDGNLPDGDGSALCQWIHSKWKKLPIIFLAAGEKCVDGSFEFLNDTDDYIEKPFELEVLFLRILALLRRTGNVSKQYLSCGDILLDQKRMLVFYGAEEVGLNAQEYQMLLFLLQNKGKTVTREQLLKKVWDNRGDYADNNALAVTMRRLREKLHKPSGLKTVRGVGYCLEEE